MNAKKLTNGVCPAHKALIQGMGAERVQRAGTKRSICWVMVMFGTALLGGCITINAPEDAIVIELNINITQEVIYRLAADAGNTIDDNADIF